MVAGEISVGRSSNYVLDEDSFEEYYEDGDERHSNGSYNLPF